MDFCQSDRLMMISQCILTSVSLSLSESVHLFFIKGPYVFSFSKLFLFFACFLLGCYFSHWFLGALNIYSEDNTFTYESFDFVHSMFCYVGSLLNSESNLLIFYINSLGILKAFDRKLSPTPRLLKNSPILSPCTFLFSIKSLIIFIFVLVYCMDLNLLFPNSYTIFAA